MKANKRFLSALLAAVMVGQMGVVVGVAADVTCTGADHGMTNRVTAPCGENTAHWLSRTDEGTLNGGIGTNYFYPKVAGTTISCGAGKNIIVFETIPATTDDKFITITSFDADDVIYLPSGKTIAGDTLEDAPEDGEEDIPVDFERSFMIDNCKVVVQGADYKAYTGKIKIENKTGTFQFAASGNLPATKEVDKGTALGLSVTTENHVGTRTYIWETEDASAWKEIQKGTSNTLNPNHKLEKEIGTITKYRCTVIDEIGQVLVSQVVEVTSTGCAVTGTLKDIAGISNDGTTVFETDTRISVNDLIEFDNALCRPKTGITHEKHGYTMGAWKVEPVNAGVKVENGELVLTAAEFPKDATTPVTLTATLNKDGQTPQIKEYKFIVKGTAAQPPENPNPENPENPGGTTDPDPNNPGGTTDPENPGGTTDPENPGGTTDPENPGGTTDPKPEETKPVEIKGADGAEPVKDLKFEEEITTPRELTYSVGFDKAVYDVTWTLTPQKDFIKCEPKNDDSTSAVVTVTKTPDPGTHTFTLTATPAPKTTRSAPAKARAAAPAAQADTPAPVSIQLQFTGPAKAADTCAATPKTAALSGVPQLPVTFLNDELATPKQIKLGCAVTEWNSADSCTKTTDHTGGHHGETVVWSIEGTPEPNWVEIDKDTGIVTFHGDKLPSFDNKVTVKATVTANGSSVESKTEILVKRAKKCDRVLTIKGDPTPIEGKKTIAVTDKDVVEPYKLIAGSVTETGTCEFGDTPGEICKNHTIQWELDELPSGAKAELKEVTDEAGKVDPTAVRLLVYGKTFPKGNRTIKLKAFVAGKPETKYVVSITVNRSTSSGSGSGSGSSSDDDDRDDSDWYQWQDIDRDISRARKGATVKASLKDNTDMPFYIFDDLRGEDVNLRMTVTGGYTWTLNGKTVKKLPENQVWVALGVKKYSNSKMANLCRDNDIKSFELENTGSFYGDMHLSMNLGRSYAKKTVSLYSYDENKNKLTYQSSAKVDEDGGVEFVFTRSLGAYVITSKTLYGENPVTTGGGTVGGGSTGGNQPATVYPPVVPTQPSSQTPAASGSSGGSSSSGSSSGESSSSGSESAPPPAEPSSDPDTTPVDTVVDPEPEEKAPIPVIVPVLILAIAGVITATVLVVRNNKNKDDGFDIE